MSDAVLPEISRNYIDGEWVETGERRTLINPSTGEPNGESCEADVALTERAVAAARRAFDDGPWSRWTPEERCEVLKDVVDHLMERTDDLVDIEAANAGATKRTGSIVHVGIALSNFDHYAEAALTPMQEALPPTENPYFAPKWVVREPLGVCAGIVPWNVPLLMAIWKVAPALAMGNTVVLKPAPATPMSVQVLAGAFDACGLPPGVFNLVLGDAVPGEALASSPDVDKISFTGSTPVGKRVMQLAASNVKKVTLELGGKSANILLDDADLDVAIDGSIFGFTFHSGQFCESGTRLLVPEHLHDEVVERLRDRLGSVVIGSAEDWDTDLGPLISQAQLDRVAGYVDLGCEEGAKVVAGGRRPPHLDAGGYFYEPTVLAGVDNSMRVAQEEIFGPVLCVIPYRKVDDAIAIANDSPYGLAGGVFSEDVTAAVEVARRVRAGTLWVNDWHLGVMDAPFGGYKQSGLGREHGRQGLEEFCETKAIHVSQARPEQRLFGMMMSG
ncbi:aldehyde dehydrogenase family protein [Nitriliruptor alkaliphilus]|uniref:aldehyde dehydrogenase family protein n=1 Tax=Nitriliruptor alkaliphilus TaxID=427918 RepID=UPI0006981307|nr:aldehyde dehydrogenase family protein [Nitriliruptor alkaliphilus]